MNDPERLAAVENQLQLGQSFASISEHKRGEAMRKKEGTKHELLNLAPLAKDNLAKKNRDVSKITKKQICSSPCLLPGWNWMSRSIQSLAWLRNYRRR
jgi:hypothetical protein